MPDHNRKLILITGIPGTGKTTYGESFAKQFGFMHYDLEDNDTLQRFVAAPGSFIHAILQRGGDVVVTWGFVPDDASIQTLGQFKAKGFTLAWFDGNRPAAFRAFIKRGDVPEELLYLQMFRIENSKVVERIAPLIINTFGDNEQFRDAREVLDEITKGNSNRQP